MFRGDKNLSKDVVLEKCMTWWNPGRTQDWLDMGIDIVIGKREGYYFYDMDGKKFMNVHLNGGTFNLGHRNPEVVQAMIKGMEEFDIGNHHFGSLARGILAEQLNQNATKGMQYSIFSSCGGEAVDVAIKSARYATKRKKIVSLENCYHGHTGLALAAGNDFFKEPFLCQSSKDEFDQVPLNNVQAMEQMLLKEDVAAVIIETIPATYGFPIPQKEFLKKVKELCEKYGSLYIADEVQTGLMRTGKMWAIEHEDVEPDILVSGKGLSGGIYPFAATIMTKKAGVWVEEAGRKHTSTFGGAEVGCVVASKVLEITTRKDTIENVHFLSRYLSNGLNKIMSIYPDFFIGYRQRGLVMGLEFDYPEGGQQVMRSLYDNGIWAIFARFDPRVVQFKPGLLCSKEYCDELLEKLEKGIGEARQVCFK